MAFVVVRMRARVWAGKWRCIRAWTGEADATAVAPGCAISCADLRLCRLAYFGIRLHSTLTPWVALCAVVWPVSTILYGLEHAVDPYRARGLAEIRRIDALIIRRTSEAMDKRATCFLGALFRRWAAVGSPPLARAWGEVRREVWAGEW